MSKLYPPLSTRYTNIESYVCVAEGVADVTLRDTSEVGGTLIVREFNVSECMTVIFGPAPTPPASPVKDIPVGPDPTPSTSFTPTPTISVTPTEGASPTPTPTITPTPESTSTPTPTPDPTPTPTPSEFIYPSPTPLPSRPPQNTPTPSATPASSPIVEDALIITPGEAQFIYYRGSLLPPASREVSLTNRFSESTLVVTINSDFVYPNVLTLGALETKTVIITLNEVEYLETLPFGDTLGGISLSVVRNVIPTPTRTPDPTPTPTMQIYGCMNPIATNYNPAASIDDGTCELPVIACRDPAAMNYDPLATSNDPTSCRYEIKIKKISGDNQTVDDFLIAENPIVAQVVTVDAETQIETPVPNVLVFLQSDGRDSRLSVTRYIDSFVPVETTTELLTDTNGMLLLNWRLDSTVVNSQARFSIDTESLNTMYTVTQESVIFSSIRSADQFVTRTPITSGIPGVTGVPNVPIVTQTPTPSTSSLFACRRWEVTARTNVGVLYDACQPNNTNMIPSRLQAGTAFAYLSFQAPMIWEGDGDVTLLS